jgi:hypothetical protein
MNFYWKIYNFMLKYLVFICVYIEEHKLDMPLEDIMQSED